MKQLRIPSLALVAFPALVSCGGIPGKMTGTYRASNGERIHVEKPRGVIWTPPGKPGERHYLGLLYGPFETSKPIDVTVSSNTPYYLDLKLAFSPDYSRLTVDWGDGRFAKKERAKQYLKER